MPFDRGVPPPSSKYHGMTFTLENFDICIDDHAIDKNENDDWMCTSGFDKETYIEIKSDDEEDEVEVYKLQKYTSQQWLE